MTTTTTSSVISAPELRRRLGITNSAQFMRVLPELVAYGAFKPSGMHWRMYESDFNRYLEAKRAEAAAKVAATSVLMERGRA